jgi:hypothetical protein
MNQKVPRGCAWADKSRWIGCLAAAALLLVGGPAFAGVGIDVTVSRNTTTNASTITSPLFSTSSGNELLLAFISTDYIYPGPNTAVTNVTGGGLTWALVVRTNVQAGTSEIWRAFAPSTLTNASVTATLSQGSRASLTVITFTGVDTSGTFGSGAIGRIGSANGATGAPSATLQTSRAGSWVFGVGNDYDNAISRTVGPNQTLVQEYLTSVGDTYWVQRQNAPTPIAGTDVTINDTAPTGDRWNLSICEILPAPAGAPQTFNVSGSISPLPGGSGVSLLLGGGLLITTTTDSAGNFQFTGVPNGTFPLTPTKPGFTFVPANRSVTVNGADVTNVTFTAHAVPTSWPISGTVSPASLADGTRLILGETGDVFPDSLGNFTFLGIPNGTYAIVPSKTGYSFTPSMQVVTVNGGPVTGVNFTIEPTLSGVGQWSAPFDLGVAAANMVLLHTGQVLMSSGSLSDVRVWDPATGSLIPADNPFSDLFCAGHSQLPDGRILFAGGYDPAALGAAKASIFDPVSQSWTALPDMTYRRCHPTSTALPDGRALITSGAQSCPTCLADVPEVFDPKTDRFSLLPTARLGIPYHAFMFVLPDGKVINAGANEAPSASAMLNMTTRTWSTVDPNVKDGHSAASYLPGKILKSGTASASGGVGNAQSTAYAIDMNSAMPAWRQVASMAFPRAFHNTTMLPDGNVLVTGGSTALDGSDTTKAVLEGELWSPVTEKWQMLARAAVPRLYGSTALLLPDGRVLVAGSRDNAAPDGQTHAEIYSPGYLFKGARPDITWAPASVQYGTTFSVDTPNAAVVAKVSLIRPGSVTDSFDQDQRYVSLSFTRGSGTLAVQAPANANVAPPGYYMLFIVTSTGVPSVATFVQLPAAQGDTQPPTAPLGLSAESGVGKATLNWGASSDDTGVAFYSVYRSPTAGFTPGISSHVGQTTSTTYVDRTVMSGTYYYRVIAHDVAGNISDPSNEATAFIAPDTTAPTVAMTAPDGQSTVNGTIAVSANATDDVGIVHVQFKLDGNPLGNPQTTAPFTLTWNTTTTTNGSHTLSAAARDAAGNSSESSVTVTVQNGTPLPAGLVAAYGFNEPDGVQLVNDASGQANTGTITGATRTSAGKYGRALSFNGANAWVTVADAPSLRLTTGLTVSAWVRPTAVDDWRTVVMKEGPDGMAYTLYAGNSAARPAGYVRVGIVDTPVNGTSDMLLNAWTHLAYTYDGATLHMFVNGVEVSSEAAPGSVVVTDGVLRIGGNSAWGEFFSGVIDEVRVYNRALTGLEIQADMGTPIPN